MSQLVPFEVLNTPATKVEKALPIEVVDTWMILVYKQRMSYLRRT